jgi:thioredoxin-related protein
MRPAACLMLTLVSATASAIGLPAEFHATNGKRAMEAAAQSGKPIIVYFTQQNCIWCERVERLLSNSPQSAALIQSYHFVNVDIGNNRDSVVKSLQKALKVSGTPSFAALSAQGNLLCMFYGMIPDDATLSKVHANVQALNKGARATAETNGFPSCRGETSELDRQVSGVQSGGL